MQTTVDRVLFIDTLLWIVGVGLCVTLGLGRAPWLLPVGSVALVLVAAVLVMHRHRRRAQIKRWQADRLARRQGGSAPRD